MLKKLAGSLREFWKDSILAPSLVVLEVIFEVIIPFLMATLIDNGIKAGDLSYIKRIGLFLFISAFLSLIIGLLSGRFAAFAATGLARNLRRDIFYRVQDLSFANIDKFSTASLISRMTTDVSNLQMAYQMALRVLVKAPVMLVLSFILVLVISPPLSLIFAVTIPVLSLVLYGIIKAAHPIFTRGFKLYDRLNTVVEENLHGIRVVKSFVREGREVEKFETASQDIYDNFLKAERLMALNMPIMQFAVFTCIMVLSWIGGHLVVGGSITTGQLVSVFAYTSQILLSLMMLSNVLVMLAISKASAERIVEILDEETSLPLPKNPVMSVANGAVSFKHAGFKYEADAKKAVLEEIDLDIAPGQTVGIIGGTGSAKTSLVQLIPRLYDVVSGSVEVGGVDVRDYDLKSLRDAVAMVLQKNVLFSGTIKENLRWGDPGASDQELVRVCELAQAADFIRSFPEGYDTYLEQGGSNLSGGQRQRLCIARALLKKPKVLILDDSTSAVDTKTDALIRQAFANDLPDTTKIIISQRISSIQDADLIIVMDDGRVHGRGIHQDLLKTNDIYREVVESQQKGGLEDGE